MKMMNEVIMKVYKYLFLFIGITGWFPPPLTAQDVLIHSHNDYRQCVPFYEAYSQHVASIEVDIYTVDFSDKLLVAHTPDELSEAPTLEESYLQPLVRLYKQNKGRAWKNSDKTLNLLVDLKTPAHPTLDKLIELLKRYPDVFNPQINPYAVRVIISGNVPDLDDFDKYPTIVSFDGWKTDYTAKQLERISIISFNLQDYTKWNGKGSMIADEYRKVVEIIDKVHAIGKPIRFWGAPDGITSWNTFYNINVDYINTDYPEACTIFFRDFHKKTYQIAGNDTIADVDRAKRLDRATADFQGFRNKNLQLSKGIEVYQPTYRNDGLNKKVKNVILMIGDGMGLAQICAADAVNRDLTLLKLKYIGLLDTKAGDAFTTDSAAGGSSLATGKKNNNRHICMSDSGEKYPSLTDVFYDKGYSCGVVTLGDISDATPAAFYGHSIERDNSDEITSYLREGKLTLLNGSGMRSLTNRNDGIDLVNDLKSKAHYVIQSSIVDINNTAGKVICIDERMGEAASEKTLPLLADATREAIKKLTSANKEGFFLMIEGAKIDYAGHANSLPGSVLEMFSFDLAIAEALRFADNNGETLVVVTADHETGGLTLVDGNQTNGSITAQYMTDDHTAIRVPIFAYGPSANEFIGAYPNTMIFHKIKEIAKIK